MARSVTEATKDGRGEQVGTLTRTELEQVRGGLEGNGAGDLVGHHESEHGSMLPSSAQQNRAAALQAANERRHQEALARRVENAARVRVSENTAPQQPPGPQPVAAWDQVLDRLIAAGFEVRGVVLAGGWLLSRG
jgi:hypothetical protein